MENGEYCTDLALLSKHINENSKFGTSITHNIKSEYDLFRAKLMSKLEAKIRWFYVEKRIIVELNLGSKNHFAKNGYRQEWSASSN